MDIKQLLWFREHWSDIVAIYGGLVIITSVIVKYTRTYRDDEVLLKIMKFLGRWIALDRTVKDKDIRKELEKRIKKGTKL